jgi:hypothetical protein
MSRMGRSQSRADIFRSRWPRGVASGCWSLSVQIRGAHGSVPSLQTEIRRPNGSFAKLRGRCRVVTRTAARRLPRLTTTRQEVNCNRRDAARVMFGPGALAPHEGRAATTSAKSWAASEQVILDLGRGRGTHSDSFSWIGQAAKRCHSRRQKGGRRFSVPQASPSQPLEKSR